MRDILNAVSGSAERSLGQDWEKTAVWEGGFWAVQDDSRCKLRGRIPKQHVTTSRIEGGERMFKVSRLRNM